jgi:4-aminobutyrate aminotransferase/(S)-3-amino-2-methylpropionate transaminase
MMNAVPKGGVGGTYGGNPVACAAALAAMSIIERDLVASGRAVEIGRRIRDALVRLFETYPLVGEVRGLGTMLAIELVRNRATREPASSETQAIVSSARASGLLLLSAGTHGNVIRFLMPLVITDQELDEGFAILDRAFAEVSR